MAILADNNKVFGEKSFFNYWNNRDGRFHPGVLVRVVDGWTAKYGTVGLFIETVSRKPIFEEPDFAVLIGEEKMIFSGFEIELL